MNVLALPGHFSLNTKSLINLLRQQRQTARERRGGRLVVRLVIGVVISCKRIRNAFQAIGTLTTLKAARF